ncbi:MAG TPA: hypothetical protein VGV37_21775 [Aliidongia sp.]|uniref:hypothetical protein n=1 Tax=Aliidongia sp. TaxID=1914230 RepID=UPI002DDD5651|nr:hypothetical protein [Aliidongia sp.]HEV2677172.1 hypothetical protein [Aliidongia sp.]
MQSGLSSERLYRQIEQLELQLEELEATPAGGHIAFWFDNGRTIFIENENDQSAFRIA